MKEEEEEQRKNKNGRNCSGTKENWSGERGTSGKEGRAVLGFIADGKSGKLSALSVTLVQRDLPGRPLAKTKRL